jgi:signal transduction histidine kinase
MMPAMTEWAHEHFERVETDSSLKTERDKTDDELRAKQTAVEQRADAVVRLARLRADRVLTAAREEEDSREEPGSPAVQQAVAHQRSIDDAVLSQERERSDARLASERGASRIVKELLRMEREETDQHLQDERGRIDRLLSSQEDVLAMVGHDLGNLLANVALNSALIIRHAAGDATGQRIIGYADRSQWAVAKAQRLLSDLTDVASISAGKLSVDPRKGDLLQVIHELAQSFQSAASSAGVELRTPESGEPLPALFDHDRMVQVLGNLLNNALKFTPRGGAISVRARRREALIELEVSDTGPGIPADKLETVFERFKQVSADRRGLGLGLYISRVITEAQGGRIWVESTLGSGSTFHLTLRPA